MSLKEVINIIYGEYDESTVFYRTNDYCVLSVDAEDSVVYSKKLNNPILVDNSAREWFYNHSKITLSDYSTASPELRYLMESYLEAMLYLPVGISEDTIIKNANIDYLTRFENGETFTSLDLRVSESCNFGCPHCIASEATHNRFMSEEVAIHCIDDYVSLKKECDPQFADLIIHFGNCEPLLNYKVIETAILYCEKKYPELKKEFSINTNISLLTRPIAVFLKEHSVEVNSSLDGPKTGNDKIRMYKNGKGTYNDIIKGFCLMEDIGTPMQGISITLNDKNYSTIDDSFFQWCEEKNFVSIGIDFDLLHVTKLTNQQKADFLVRNWVNLKKKGIELHGTWMTPFIILSNRSASHDAYAFCKASEGKNISVDAYGRIYACGYSNNYISTFDTLRNDIKPGGAYYQYIQQHLCGNTPDACHGCSIEGACVGQCEMTRCSATQNMIESQCDFYRIVTDKLLIAQSILLKEEEK